MARRSMREEIVEAALAQFHERGFNAAAVKDITDRAGVPKGSFYNHFESKEALAIVALERYGVGRRLGDLADSSVEPVARIRKHFEFLRDEVVAFGITRGCLLGNFGTEIVDHSEPIRGGVKAGLEAWTGLLAGAIAEGQEAGAIRSELDAEQTARYLLSAWEGTLIQARAYKDAKVFDSFFELTFAGLFTA
ncbi:TetR/AcrR family transcriptional regulator [Kribbella sp. CA-293567]|uniref:TetR/AcrR family transcriptional regulator n=1 Tax=Kribbella sp. CA-293567 TaxID=3002436 RepID=UPI0022DDFFA7|nr:TetR/AcrR family transcriptional regulator [Kribbella sp. CA-293567]WBQ07656.1 TetR family transcriptional regulator C-terminal domain-containing protein [Kribbella sp. CA-293567]